MQVIHPAAFADPGLDTVPADPATHTVQAATEMLPRPTVDTPEGQAVQAIETPFDDHEPSVAERVRIEGLP